MNRDGMPYLRMNRASHLVGMVGLNEMVQIHAGEEMHESKKALKFGLKIIAHLKLLSDKMKRQENMRLVLEQTPAESTSYRFAKLDLHYFSPASGRAVKGDVSSGEVYYTNSTHLNVSVPMNPIERVTNEGLFHPLDRGGLHLPRLDRGVDADERGYRRFRHEDLQATPRAIRSLFRRNSPYATRATRTSRGLADACPHCRSDEVDGITRITGYFTKVSSWNKGKLGELKDRYRNSEFFSGEQQEQEKASMSALQISDVAIREERRMGAVKIFYKDDCPKCPLAKQLGDRLKEKNVNVLAYNVGTADGLAEASFYSVMSLPTVLVEDAMENGIGEWRGRCPQDGRGAQRCPFCLIFPSRVL